MTILSILFLVKSFESCFELTEVWFISNIIGLMFENFSKSLCKPPKYSSSSLLHWSGLVICETIIKFLESLTRLDGILLTLKSKSVLWIKFNDFLNKFKELDFKFFSSLKRKLYSFRPVSYTHLTLPTTPYV